MYYRKKPHVIEAQQFNGTFAQARILAEWCNGEAARDPAGLAYVLISTLEGVMQAQSGDYIIKGIKGEFYPCKKDIFELSYEKADA